MADHFNTVILEHNTDTSDPYSKFLFVLFCLDMYKIYEFGNIIFANSEQGLFLWSLKTKKTFMSKILI